jgi:ribosomal-protein-alanine N-acetyltransferase
MRAADLDQVLGLAAACPEAPQWTAANYASYLDANPKANPALIRVAIVVAQADKIAGFAAATLRPDPEPVNASQNICELDSIAVHPAARCQGVGAELLRAVLAWAVTHKATRLVLEVRASNTAALRLYRRFGLRLQGRRPRYYTHPEEDALLLDIPVTEARQKAPFSTEKVIEGGPPRC